MSSKLGLANVMSALAFVSGTAGASAQTAPPEFPIAIICYAPADQSWRTGYLYRVQKSGDALYIAPDGKLGATVDATGTVLAPKNRRAGLDCYGKTLVELRATGRVLEFRPAK